METRQHRYDRYRKTLAGEALPVALVDLDAVDANVDAITSLVRGSHGKTLRIGTKSVRSVDLIRHILNRGGPSFRGLMAYAPAEARYLAAQGFDDILIAYPTAQPADARLLAEANHEGKRVSIAVEEPIHLDVLEVAAASHGVRIPVVVDIDVSLRRLGGRVHLGVRRSPLHEARGVADFAERVASSRHLEFAGLLGYEAHIAGTPDQTPLGPLPPGAKRAFKRIACTAVTTLRHEITAEFERRRLPIPLFNGGGTGSVASSLADPSLTEITVGSGFLGSHLFDHYDDFRPEPAAFFALQVTRRPAPGFVTCQGGGLVASGAAGPDRLPIPYLPEGLALLDLEGAGEVQTPLAVPPHVTLAPGDPVFFRHAKAGELATFFRDYLLVRGDRVESRALTYRGAGECFH
ncbi:alanine racemase [Polyangium sp. y55x31]|uniref:alanine racemase n=1 Tax=Polyangium sp. y55x31 TaxID=3042688 RepID=UPI0024823621|nr:alanine racemase [Polyangium sp. y55x31]MDI1483479.1 alanine racemase [Polyangium sp. y55x31]